ncbi:predicted protein [Arabidopsis lyrata subsp. lyrata]|uniref:Predicted protein n=1 Tax=Arabidopsis lyrata subsp. lyrata TaxID=81972 RepID=D7MQ13_ARALL|nr:predicted protein [Arabidopsis lyrata subsp. lyrata]
MDAPMWEGPDGVLYKLTSDDSGQPQFMQILTRRRRTVDRSARCLLSQILLSPTYHRRKLIRNVQTAWQVLAYNMVPPSEVFATPPESGIPNFMKAESPRLSTLPRTFATRTWYPGYHGEEGVESFHANLENLVGHQEVPDVTTNCETLLATPLRVEQLGVLFPPNEKLHELTLGSSSLDAMMQNMIAAGTLGVEPLRPPEGTPVWRERVIRSADGTFVPTMEREDGLMFEPWRVTPFCFTSGQDGHYPRTCPYVHHYHPYARPYVVYFECGNEGHYASICSRKYPENPGPSSPSPSASARKLKGNLSTY